MKDLETVAARKALSASRAGVSVGTKFCFEIGIPSGILTLEFCDDIGKSYISAATSRGGDGKIIKKPLYTVKGEIQFPCSLFSCAPSGGQITASKTIDLKVPGKMKKLLKAFKFSLSGTLGGTVAMVRGSRPGKLDVSVSPFGSLAITTPFCEIGGTIAGIVTLKDLDIKTFHIGGASVGVSVTAYIKILGISFSVTIKMDSGGKWKLSR